MPLDHYVTLGRSGLRVSPLCLGAMTFGEDFGWGSSVEESEADPRPLHRAAAATSSTPPTSTPRATPRRSSATTSAATRRKRDRLVIATKFSGNLYPGDPNGGGSGRKSIIAACEQSLRRLQTDYIDLYWLHTWDAHTPIEETMRALDDLVRAGKVRYLGFSDTPAWKVAEAQRHRALPRLVAAHRAADRVLAARAHRRGRARSRWRASSGLGVTPWSPLKSGVLSGKYTRAERGPARRPTAAPVRRAAPQRARPTRSSTSSSAIAKELDTTVGARGARVGAGAARA